MSRFEFSKKWLMFSNRTRVTDSNDIDSKCAWQTELEFGSRMSTGAMLEQHSWRKEIVPDSWATIVSPHWSLLRTLARAVPCGDPCSRCRTWEIPRRSITARCCTSVVSHILNQLYEAVVESFRVWLHQLIKCARNKKPKIIANLIKQRAKCLLLAAIKEIDGENFPKKYPVFISLNA